MSDLSAAEFRALTPPEMSSADERRLAKARDYAEAATDAEIHEAVCDALTALYGPNWLHRVADWIEAREVERLELKDERDALSDYGDAD